MVFSGFSYFCDLGGNHKHYEDVEYEEENVDDLIHKIENDGYRYIGNIYSTKNRKDALGFGKEVGNSETKMVIIDSIGT